MKPRKTLPRPLAAASALAAILLAAVLFVPKEPAAEDYLGGISDPDIRSRAAGILDLAAREGPAEAYRSFAAEFGPKDPYRYHGIGHALGRFIYDREGPGETGICTHIQNWACFHGFFGRAMDEQEPAAVIPLAEASCAGSAHDEPGRCAHGLGHGLLHAAGYDVPGIVRALGWCGLMKENALKENCEKGVFKEYNDRQIWPFEGEKVSRRFPEQKLEPCAVLPERYARNCYYELAYWWAQMNPADYRGLAAHCGDVPVEEGRNGCFTGIGRAILTASRYDPEQASAACAAIADETGRAACARETLRILTSTYGEMKPLNETEAYAVPGPSESFCASLKEGEEAACREAVRRFWCEKKGEC